MLFTKRIKDLCEKLQAYVNCNSFTNTNEVSENNVYIKMFEYLLEVEKILKVL